MTSIDRENSAFVWYPGSDEWAHSLPAGDFYNATEIIQPWEIMNGREQNVDLSGLLASEYFRGQVPASPDQSFAGSDAFYIDFNR